MKKKQINPNFFVLYNFCRAKHKKITFPYNFNLNKSKKKRSNFKRIEIKKSTSFCLILNAQFNHV
jgi:hypothetical protein